jgi:hypothetical protein
MAATRGNPIKTIPSSILPEKLLAFELSTFILSGPDVA